MLRSSPEADGDAVECDPSTLGVEAVHGYIFCTGIADNDQKGNFGSALKIQVNWDSELDCFFEDRRWASTKSMTALTAKREMQDSDGGQGRDRTADASLFRAALYR